MGTVWNVPGLAGCGPRGLAALSLLWFVTTVAHIQLFHQLTFVLLIGVWGFVVFGREAEKMNLVDLPRGEQWRVEETAADRTFSWRPAYKGAGQEETESFTDGRT